METMNKALTKIIRNEKICWI